MSKRARKDSESDSSLGAFPAPAGKKTKRLLIGGQPGLDQVRCCQEIMEALRAHKLEDGRLLCEGFLRAPSRRSQPDYYKQVANPIDLMRIQQKVKTDEIESLDALTADVQLLAKNARDFYKRGSPEAKDADDLLRIFEDIKRKILTESGVAPPSGVSGVAEAGGASSRDVSPSPSSRSLRSNSPAGGGRGSTRSGRDTTPGRLAVTGGDPVHASVLAELLACVMELTDETNRTLCPPFRLLPSPAEFPEYYNAIREPMDLRTVGEKLRSGKYKSLNDMERDLLLMCKNAKLFNEPGSLIHRDSMAIRKFVAKRKLELMENGAVPIPNARHEANQETVDELIRQGLGEEDVAEYSEDSDEDEATESSKDSRWIVYWTVRNYVDPAQNDGCLADPFVQLPDRNWYPDYYDEVKEPMSLFMINKKLKREGYRHVLALLTDLHLLFENAKSYNIEGSDIHTNACKLQVVANCKARELEPNLNLTGLPVKLPPHLAHLGSINATNPPPSPAQAPKPKKPHRVKEPSATGEKEKGRPGRKTMEELMSRYRTKLMNVVNACWEYREPVTERWVGGGFVDRPDPKLYPDYDSVIAKPIDLRTIRSNIECDKYSCSTELGADLELMLANAREFNEETAGIVADADTLQALIHKALKALGPMPLTSPRVLKERFGWSKTRTTTAGGGTPRSGSTLSPKVFKTAANSSGLSAKDAAMEKQMWALFNAIKDYVDARGRLLSRIFMRLPSKTEYPDYYEVIKKPMDIEKIGNRLACHLYLSIDSLVADFAVMFDNACRYNEPESIVYKDALTLQKVMLQKKSEILRNAGPLGSGGTPDVQAAVQELLTTLFVELYNHQDAEGRCYSDSLAEVPELYRKRHGSTAGLLSLDRIKRNLDKERYRRLDRFQDDIFQVLDTARALSRSDSQLFEDSAELGLFFVRQRDESCKRASGECLSSPALAVSETRLRGQMDEERKSKAPLEAKEDSERPEDPRERPSKLKDGDTELASVELQGTDIKIGDFVLVRANDEKLEPHIMRVEAMWREASEGVDFLSGHWYYRPYETYHLASRKFLEREVFKTPFRDKVTTTRVVGKCLVMFIRKFIKFAPKAFEPESVFVCESEYMGRVLHFKKLKNWPFHDEVELVERSEELDLSRTVPSVFLGGEKGDAVRAAASKEEDEAEEEEEESKEDKDFSILRKHREESALAGAEGAEPGATYFEQVKVGDGGWWIKLGDCVYARNDEKELPDVIRVDKMWRTSEGQLFLSGPWFARPVEVEHEPSRMFIKREVFAVEGCADTVVKSSDVLGRCLVMNMKDFLAWRLTEIRETDVLVVQWKVPASGRPAGASSLEDGPLSPTGPLSPPPSLAAADDSADSLDVPPPTPTPAGLSESAARRIKLLKAYKLSRAVLEDEIFYFGKQITPEQEPSPLLMKTDTSVDPADEAMLLDETNADMANWLLTQPKLNSRSKSGYILFSAEVRRRIMAEHPESTFGDVSKMVGVEWKKLNEEERKQFDVRAQVIAEERERADKVKGGGKGALQPGQIRIYQCKWKDCDFQFDASEQLFDHITTAHTSQIVEAGENQFICLWVTCAKYRKEGKPFPSLPRLHRHIKEKHMPSSVKTIFPNQRSRNYCGATPPPAPSPQTHFQAAPPPPQPQFSAQQPQSFYQSPGGQIVGAPQPSVAAPPPGHPTQQIIIDQHGQVVQGYPGQAAAPSASAPVVSGASAQQNQDPSKILVERAEPVFIPAPGSARVTRLLHSETYLRYIESLSSGSRSVSRWDKSLGANAYNTPMPANSAVPGEWLGSGVNAANKDEVVKALWNLRNSMLVDSLGIERVLKATEY